MSKISVKLNISKKILQQVDIDSIIKRIEEEILLEYNLNKLHDSMEDKNLDTLLDEV
ncbi:MAG: hypothetical protein K9W46_14020 [Candidatus Heimdallarchaeum endolithica]|uniref:Uncharacterized protein n=1 Tax=Candidatus Heimdallarchaeum endolithica TaxID=2876572 RepID=A0A9Y1BR85_9ARCH|nr:MAG: hypothetical protein K9W46_14020 [Candidatus Heimdallarchaeum endolithica]